MNFTISYKTITRCLQKAQSIVERKEIKPILSTVLLTAKNGFLDVLATNLEVGLRQRCSADIQAEGSTVVDARKLYEIVREMPEETITFHQKDNNWIEILSDNVVFELVGMEPKEFPEINFFDDEHFMFAITDNGTGIDKRTQRNIFEEFFSTKGSAGTGLGLAVVEKVVNKHGGRIEVTSTPGNGTKFRVILKIK